MCHIMDVELKSEYFYGKINNLINYLNYYYS